MRWPRQPPNRATRGQLFFGTEIGNLSADSVPNQSAGVGKYTSQCRQGQFRTRHAEPDPPRRSPASTSSSRSQAATRRANRAEPNAHAACKTRPQASNRIKHQQAPSVPRLSIPGRTSRRRVSVTQPNAARASSRTAPEPFHQAPSSTGPRQPDHRQTPSRTAPVNHTPGEDHTPDSELKARLDRAGEAIRSTYDAAQADYDRNHA